MTVQYFYDAVYCMKTTALISGILLLPLFVGVGVRLSLEVRPLAMYTDFYQNHKRYGEYTNDVQWGETLAALEKLVKGYPRSVILPKSFLHFPDASDSSWRAAVASAESIHREFRMLSQLCDFGINEPLPPVVPLSPTIRERIHGRTEIDVLSNRSAHILNLLHERGDAVASKLGVKRAQRQRDVLVFAHYTTGPLKALPLFEGVSSTEGQAEQVLNQLRESGEFDNVVDVSNFVAEQRYFFQDNALALQLMIDEHQQLVKEFGKGCATERHKMLATFDGNFEYLLDAIRPSGSLASYFVRQFKES